MATASAFIAAAAAEVGTTENPPGSNKTEFAKEADHLNGYPWCATFVVAIARRVGLRLPSESAYTPTMANGFKSAGAWHTGTPLPGDVGFIDFPGDSKNRIQHVVIVTGVRADGRVETIEGNTSSGSSGSQDNGGGVYRRVRARGLFVGFGRPAFAPEEARPAETQQDGSSAPQGPGGIGDDEMTHQEVLEVVQRMLNEALEVRDAEQKEQTRILRELVAKSR